MSFGSHTLRTGHVGRSTTAPSPIGGAASPSVFGRLLVGGGDGEG